MQRLIMNDLKVWAASQSPKPAMVNGARRVGKTWLILELGKLFGDNFIYLPTEGNSVVKNLFEREPGTTELVKGIEKYSGKELIPEKTLLAIDEAQAVPKALESIKYLYEDLPGLHIIAACSLMGLAVHKRTSYPVDTVNFNVHPLTFVEFLLALGNERNAIDILEGDPNVYLDRHAVLVKLYKDYLFIGGMPNVVNEYIKTNNLISVRNAQNEIIGLYERDFSKHTENSLEAVDLQQLWKNIQIQCQNDSSEGFSYKKIRSGGKKAEYDWALGCLKDSGIIHVIHRISALGLPLCAYLELQHFKIRLVDIGLLGAISRTIPAMLEDLSTKTAIIRGVFAEQFVLQEMLGNKIGVNSFGYWKHGNEEIEYLLASGLDIIPIEVKSGRVTNSNSLSSYIKNNKPPLAVRASLAAYKRHEALEEVPIYGIGSYLSKHKLKDSTLGWEIPPA